MKCLRYKCILRNAKGIFEDDGNYDADLVGNAIGMAISHVGDFVNFCIWRFYIALSGQLRKGFGINVFEVDGLMGRFN